MLMLFQDYLTKRQESDIVRYVEYMAAQQGISLDEAASRSLGRLFHQVEQSNNPLVIITAFRSERTLIANRSLNRLLAADIRSLGWGYTPVLGGFLEKTQDAQGQQQEVRVHEESIFVNAAGNNQEVVRSVVGLLNKYQQEAALLKLPGNDQTLMLAANGDLSPVGVWNADPQLMATYYTRMRKGPSNRQFTFEATGDDSMMTRWAVDTHYRKNNL
jgi:hypothetical protein